MQAQLLYPLLFSGISWSTEDVYTTTIHRLHNLNISVFSLPTLRDIDREEDLPFAQERGLL